MANYNSIKNAALIAPTTNPDLGSANNRYGNVYLSGNVNIAGTSITANNAIVPRIASISYPNDDTAADPAGGQSISLNGSGFVAGAAAYIGGSLAGVVVVMSSSLITIIAPAKSAGNYTLIIVNPDGAGATFVPGIQYSGFPTWSTTAGILATVYEATPVSNTVAATSDSPITYSIASGTLPTGVTLNSTTGFISGTVSVVSGTTSYFFAVDAKDGENQDTNRNFSYTVNPDTVSWSSPAPGATLSSMIGSAFSQSLTAISAAGKSITYTANSLPSGLSISGSSITGTPTAISSASTLLTATSAVTGKTSTQTINWSIIASVPVAYLLVAGAGGNPVGGGYGGGGGGGGVVRGDVVVTNRLINVVVGAGGAPGTGANASVSTSGGDGGASYITSTGISYTIQANGGGGGGGPGQPGRPGGSGGGGGTTGSAGGVSNKLTIANATSYGNSGGSGGGAGWNQGGGGGAGGIGNFGYFGGADLGRGTGGLGVLIDMGGGVTGTYGAGHTGNPSNADTGTAGLVILRYPDTIPAASATTGSPAITVSGGYRIYKWTANGSITF